MIRQILIIFYKRRLYNIKSANIENITKKSSDYKIVIIYTKNRNI